MLRAKLSHPQWQAWQLLQPGARVTLPCGRGWGKSVFDSLAIHSWCLGSPGAHVGLFMPTLKQARAVFWRPILFPDFYGDPATTLSGYVRPPNKTDLTCEYRNGSRLSTWGAENIQQARGQRFTHIVQDEADEFDPDDERSVMEPTFSKSGVNAIWLKTGTPKRGRYGTLFESFRQGQDGSPERKALIEAGLDPRTYVSMLFRSDQSPFVDPAWLENTRRKLLAMGRKTTWLREYCCDFDAAEGLVYSMFEPGWHVRLPDYGVPWTEILVGVDHGTADPGVILVAGVIGNGRDATIHLLEEIYQTDRDTSWWCQQAAAVAGRYRAFRQRWYLDPSRPDRLMDIRKAIRAAHPDLGGRFSIDPGVNDIEAGVDAVADRMMPREPVDEKGEPLPRFARFYVSPACKNTIAELSLYRRKRDPKNQERVLDDIVDKDNHACDAARYLTFTRFGGPSKERHEIG